MKSWEEVLSQWLLHKTNFEEDLFVREVEKLREVSTEIRKSILKMIHAAKSGHPGGSLSAVEILTALYYDEMNVDASNPKFERRDRFVLSKGHAAPVLYATLAEKGFFPKDEIMNLRKIDSMLQGHPDRKGTPGVEVSTGSLGQGFSVACGLAMASKVEGSPYRVYTLLGDGELQEGLVWEAAMSAAHYKLDNIAARTFWPCLHARPWPRSFGPGCWTCLNNRPTTTPRSATFTLSSTPTNWPMQPRCRFIRRCSMP